jgi:hypothetical protein
MVSQQTARKKGHPTKTEVMAEPFEWLKVKEAAIEARVSPPVIYSFVKQGLIDSFLLKTRPDSQSGVRLIRRSSLRSFLERQFREQQLREPLVRIPGRKREEAILRGAPAAEEDLPF